MNLIITHNKAESLSVVNPGAFIRLNRGWNPESERMKETTRDNSAGVKEIVTVNTADRSYFLL